jgi:hypothetical protein
MRVRVPAILLAAMAAAMPAQAAVFSFEFAFPGFGIADIPGSEELASNQIVTTEVTVFNPIKLSLYRLRQRDSATVLGNLPPPGADVDLVLGSNRFEIDDQAFDLNGQLVGTFTYSGGMKNKLGMVFDDGGDVFTYYADLPFRFYIDQTATYDGIGPFTGGSDVIWFTLPGDTGLYRLQAAVPEPASWVMMIAGFGLAGAAMRSAPARRRRALA